MSHNPLEKEIFRSIYLQRPCKVIYSLYQQCFPCLPSASAGRRTSPRQERSKEHQSLLAGVHWLLETIYDEYLKVHPSINTWLCVCVCLSLLLRGRIIHFGDHSGLCIYLAAGMLCDNKSVPPTLACWSP